MATPVQTCTKCTPPRIFRGKHAQSLLRKHQWKAHRDSFKKLLEAKGKRKAAVKQQPKPEHRPQVKVMAPKRQFRKAPAKTRAMLGQDPLLQALATYEAELAQAQSMVTGIRKLIAERNGVRPQAAGKPAKKVHRISPEGRARIAAAQRNRWAAAKQAATAAAAD